MIRSTLFASLAIFSTLFGVASAQEKAPDAKPINTSVVKSPERYDFVMGKKDAPVFLVEYASLTCPHCAHFHSSVVPVLEKKYIDTGKVKYSLRPYPLNEPALKGAELVDCLGEEGGVEKYYTFIKVLFDAQDKWAYETDYMKAVETIAGVGGVSKEQVASCTSDQAREKKILQIRKVGSDELHVNHTPYLFINGVPYEGKPTPEDVSAYIDNLLQKK